MREDGQSRVIGLLGVGFDNEDGHIRITKDDAYQVLMGSGETHQELHKICLRIDESLKASGRVLSDCSPEEFIKLVQELY